MKVLNLAFKRGREAVHHNIASWTKRRRRFPENVWVFARHQSSGPAEESIPEGAKQNGKKRATDKKMDRFSNRDFFLSVLGSTATKREAGAYLRRFKPTKEVPQETEKMAFNSKHHGVNLGTFYRTIAVSNSPKFVQQPTKILDNPLSSSPLHIAIVKIRAPQHLDDERLNGVGRTLAQLARLGLTSTVVVDCDDGPEKGVNAVEVNWRRVAIQQVDRIVTAIELYGEPGARKIDNIIGVSEQKTEDDSFAACIRGKTHVIYRKLLMTPLRRGVIPVIAPVGYTDRTHKTVKVKADDVVLALTREFAGFHEAPSPDENPHDVSSQLEILRKEVSLDRLIVLDPLGGIPTTQRSNGYHVFLNLEQEFSAAKQDLLTLRPAQSPPKAFPVTDSIQRLSKLGASNQLSPFGKIELFPGKFNKSTISSMGDEELPASNKMHLQNLELVRSVLSILPPSSSALLTTPEEASNSEKKLDEQFQVSGVGTRRVRNPLIHNLLTDKPIFSSSLPASRMTQPSISETEKLEPVSPIATPTTFAKRGMPVTILPDPRIHLWAPPSPGSPGITLTDSQIDLPRLVRLIEDSFDRKLDVNAYLKRVNDRIAGVIIAGEYEGGALLTWETPPGVVDDGSEVARARMVPYLDKFAVLKRSQGSGGVADIVFKAMVRDCFPDGVCWRSRRNNPVNKWYFERSRGTWKMPDTNWTMFWTTPDLDVQKEVFSDYEKICRTVEPSWADVKDVMD